MVSIIVPVYNREKYLRRCIDSIVCQTYSDIEIILVDDGSTDSSGRICDEYAAIDSRIKVIHQQNIGPSISRIRAIRLANGEFVQFVDSDDWIEPNMVECMLEKSEGVDVVWCNAVLHYPESRVFNIHFDSSSSVMLNEIYNWKVPAWLCNKLFRKEIWHDIESTQHNVVEDIFYMTQILSKKTSMAFVEQPLYHYDRTPSDSLTKLSDYLEECMPNIERCYSYLLTHNCLMHYKASLANLALKCKFKLANSGRYLESQSFLSFSNFDIRNYPVSFPVSIIYWIGFNCKVIGRPFLSAYMLLWRNRH